MLQEKTLILCGMVRSNRLHFSIDIELQLLCYIGSIPYDGVPNKETVTVHPAVTSIYIILALGGIVFAIVCLIFNFIYRNEKYAVVISHF